MVSPVIARVIARSDSDEAIQNGGAKPDGFASRAMTR